MDRDNDLMSLLKVLYSYRLLVLACLAAFAAAGFFSRLGSPKVYQGEALVSIPMIAGPGSDAEDTSLVSVAETRAMVNHLWARLRRGGEPGLISDTLFQKMRLVRVDDVRGTGRGFKLVVQSASDPQATLATMDRLLGHLKNNQYLTGRYQMKKAELDSGLQDAGLALDRATKLRDEALRLMRGRGNIGFNPVELEAKTNELRDRHSGLKSKLSMAHSYQYLDRPYVRTNPVSPRPWRDLFLFGFLGFLLGLMLAILVHFLVTTLRDGGRKPGP